MRCSTPELQRRMLCAAAAYHSNLVIASLFLEKSFIPHMCPKDFFRETQVPINPRLSERVLFRSPPLYSGLSKIRWRMRLIYQLIHPSPQINVAHQVNANECDKV